MQNQFQSSQSNFPPNPLEQKKSNSDLYSQNGSSHQAPTELLVLLEQTRSSTLVTRSSSKKTSRFLQWFYDLPVRRKQVLALLTSELISAVGLVGMGSLLIIQGGRIQLLNQAKSEVAVTEIGYNIKINQMGFGFRGQSENTAIIDAALANAQGSALSPEQIQRVKGILANEVKVRQIEYATLVGTDLEIIVNANRDRTGERFDPEGLVGTVLANPRQIRTSALVSGEELEREAPPLPEGYDGSEALIRYTFTPVFDPATDAVIGVLVSGDIVNNKAPIVEQTLDALQNGYSAVYTYNETEGFKLATSMDLGTSTNLEDAQVGVTLPSTNLLESAIQSENGTAAYRVPLGEQTYSMAASVIQNFNNEPIGVLVRGTSERSLNQLIWNSLRLQIIVACIAITADILLATILGRSIVRPLQGLRMMTQRFAEGDRQTRAEVFADDEVGQLTVAVNQLADAVTDTEATLQAQARYQEKMANQAQFVTELTSEIRQSLDPNEILRIAVDGVREVMETDRVVVYRFNGDLKSGIITAESVNPHWDKTIGVLVEDPLVPEALERFRSGKLSVMDDLEKANLSNCHCQILQRFQVKANIAAPIIVGDELIGLLCAHECAAPRTWTREDIALMQQLSAQIGYALAQANLLRLQQERAGVERQINHIVSDMRRSLDQTEVYRIAVEETRAVLKADRVAVYSFLESGEGFFVAESVEAGYTPVLGRQLLDPCFNEKYHEQYRQGRVKATPDIYAAGLKDCHLRLLEPFEVKANIVTPILVDKTLIGLLIAHQCSGPRNWTEMDVNFLQQIALQLGYALDQVKLFAQKEEARLEAENLSAEQRRQKEMLQQQLLMLLGDVEGASRGDLTVRADVTAGDIGTVADFFNSIIESLRQIVIQVKESATQVNSSLGQNEDAIQQLAEVALQQMEETNATLDTVEQITKSIQVVADNARQAAEVAHLASKTAETGGTAIDLTVQNILQLRETVGETAKKVKRLGESSQQISKVVSLINQIALQTNLLAINAGIEAARAGEEGQGFAVVAEEVGELASRSANATQEIEKIVEAIQRETSEVVAAMEQSTSQVVEGTRLVEDAKQSLSQVLEVSRQIDQLVQSISETTVSQVSTSESVSRLMKEIAHVSERTSMSSRQVSNALRQTVEIAQELQASVGTFKV